MTLLQLRDPAMGRAWRRETSMHVNEFGARRTFLTLLLPAVFCTFEAVSTAGMQSQALRISVDDPRPMASAIEILEKRHGWVITYEDPPYVDPNEMSDVTQAVRKDYDSQKPRVLVPRGGPFSVDYTIQSGALAPQEAGVLERVVQAHNSTGNPGVFRLLRTGSVFHVVPSMSRNLQGSIQQHNPVLDTIVSAPAGTRTAYEQLETILAQVSKSARVSLKAGTTPLNWLANTRVEGSVTNESARAALVRLLSSSSTKFSWQLFYGPMTNDYVLNIHVVRGSTEQSK